MYYNGNKGPLKPYYVYQGAYIVELDRKSSECARSIMCSKRVTQQLNIKPQTLYPKICTTESQTPKPVHQNQKTPEIPNPKIPNPPNPKIPNPKTCTPKSQTLTPQNLKPQNPKIPNPQNPFKLGQRPKLRQRVGHLSQLSWGEPQLGAFKGFYLPRV